MGSKNDSYYIQKALSEIDQIIEYTINLQFEEFIGDKKTIDATMFRLQQMIEAIKSISKEYKESHSEIPWGEIVGLRNRIVHEYGKIDYTTVFETIDRDIYELKDLFESSL